MLAAETPAYLFVSSGSEALKLEYSVEVLYKNVCLRLQHVMCGLGAYHKFKPFHWQKHVI